MTSDGATTPGAKGPLAGLAELVTKLAALPDLAVDFLDETFARATSSVAAALPCFPAATLGSLAIGLPHAHPAHPPYSALVPTGPIILGWKPTVLINGRPAAVLGSLGLSPTCGGLTALFEVETGSSKVFIGGERAARMFDLTSHCHGSPSRRPRHQLLPTSLEQVDEAARQLMGLDPTMPPGGSPGLLVLGSPNVLIGGFPTPDLVEQSRGLLRLLPRLRHHRSQR